MITLEGSPYCFDEVESPFLHSSSALTERVALLRGEGTLRDETLRAYFGDKRFEEIAESNAIEGSTLDVRETQLAVLSGIAVTGHDPAYVRDAINLARALDRTVELASQQRPTDIEQVKEVHALILGERPGAGMFRSEAIRISGSDPDPQLTNDLGCEGLAQASSILPVEVGVPGRPTRWSGSPRSWSSGWGVCFRSVRAALVAVSGRSAAFAGRVVVAG